MCEFLCHIYKGLVILKFSNVKYFTCFSEKLNIANGNNQGGIQIHSFCSTNLFERYTN